MSDALLLFAPAVTFERYAEVFVFCLRFCVQGLRVACAVCIFVSDQTLPPMGSSDLVGMVIWLRVR